eukprot:175175-Chlamydomonas_euryale.AAC.3
MTHSSAMQRDAFTLMASIIVISDDSSGVQILRTMREHMQAASNPPALKDKMELGAVVNAGVAPAANAVACGAGGRRQHPAPRQLRDQGTTAPPGDQVRRVPERRQATTIKEYYSAAKLPQSKSTTAPPGYHNQRVPQHRQATTYEWHWIQSQSHS